MVRLRPDPIPGNNSVGHSLAGSRRAKRVGPLAAMILGFCALLILMTLLAFDSIHALRELEASSASVRQRYLVRERTLREIRFSLYESGNLLREFALVDPNAETRESYLARTACYSRPRKRHHAESSSPFSSRWAGSVTETS